MPHSFYLKEETSIPDSADVPPSSWVGGDLPPHGGGGPPRSGDYCYNGKWDAFLPGGGLGCGLACNGDPGLPGYRSASGRSCMEPSGNVAKQTGV